MGRYILAIFIIALPVLCFFYYCYIVSIAFDKDEEKLIKEVASPTFFLYNSVLIAFFLVVCIVTSTTLWDIQKNINTPHTYYTEAELVAKDTTTVFKVTDNGNKINYYETDISLNIADNGNYKNDYMLVMSDNITREDKSDDIILAVYNTVGEINTEVK